jgi:hypothetical protein
MYVANGTPKMSVSEPRFADRHFRSTIYHIYIVYSLPPDNGMLLPKTYRSILKLDKIRINGASSWLLYA